jgi:hypothetical protein
MRESGRVADHEFNDCGYVIVRGVLDAGEVRRARELCGSYLPGTGTQEMMTAEFLADEFLAGIPLRPAAVGAVRELVGGQVVLYPNCTARKNVYVPWHVDETFSGRGTEYMWEPGFAHVQAGLYLQDNDEDTGGGIDVIRGSHLMSFDGYGRLPADFSVAGRTLGASFLRATAGTKAGDLVLWHARLMHASTAELRRTEADKFGIHFSYGREDLRDNHRFLCQIASESVRTVNGISREIPRLAEIARFRYPDSFPEHFLKSLADAGVKTLTQ